VPANSKSANRELKEGRKDEFRIEEGSSYRKKQAPATARAEILGNSLD
jgi:hypothetical protein